MLVLVGNSPSSGSTLLADLLDSTDFTACGNELNFWSNKFLYEFEKFKENPSLFSNTHQITSTGLFPHYKFLNQYGIEKKLWHKWISQSESVQEFSEHFTLHFLGFRQKSNEGIVFEKSPENINAVSEFLQAFPESYFINIIRNPLYVYASCLKRGFGNYSAAMNWMIDASVVKAHLEHPRFISIRYEDLVEDPFTIVADLINSISGKEVKVQALKESYETNIYKKRNANKIKSWEISEYGKVKNANLKELDSELIRNFSAVSNYQIAEDYAKLFGLESHTYFEMAAEFGYELPSIENTEIIKNYKDYRKLLAKAYRYGGISKNNFRTILNPVRLIN